MSPNRSRAQSSPPVLDGQAWEHLRIGMIVAYEMEGSMWRKKGGGVAMNFSSISLRMAGGTQKFLAEWERCE